MDDTAVRTILRRHIGGRETLEAGFSAYTGGGFGRLIIGVTERRLLAVKSAYWSIKDRGLLWAEWLDEVALSERATELHMNGANTGNTYVRLRRADGTVIRLNPRSSFVGDTGSAASNLAVLYARVPGRF